MRRTAAAATALTQSPVYRRAVADTVLGMAVAVHHHHRTITSSHSTTDWATSVGCASPPSTPTPPACPATPPDLLDCQEELTDYQMDGWAGWQQPDPAPARRSQRLEMRRADGGSTVTSNAQEEDNSVQLPRESDIWKI